MPATASVSLTGDPYIDGVLSGTRWGVSSLTYSFPTSAAYYEYSGEPGTNFEAFTAAQQDAVRKVLANYTAIANLTFTEVAETSSQHATLRYAESDSLSPGSAWAYFPSSWPQGGDMWFNNSSNVFDNPIKGNAAYFVMLHETGHAIGLKHTHEVMGSFGTEPLDHDLFEYSVMSYRAYVGAAPGQYTNDFPQTLMMYDIAAVQTMYGANYNTNSGDTVYVWSPTTGEMSLNGVGMGALAGNKIFMTIWDGGGQDTYDFSDYTTALAVNLQPGGWTTASTTQLAYLGDGHYAAGNIANALLYNNNPASLIENVIGGADNDVMTGNIADNHFTGGGGNDVFDGGSGNDSAIYSGLTSDYSWSRNANGSWTITDLRTGSLDGADTLWNLEFLQFSDSSVAIGSYTPPAPPVVTNTTPSFTSSAQSVSLTEWADRSTNESLNTAHIATGTMSFADPDGGDTHAVAFTPEGPGYLGTFTLTGLDDATGSVGWTFSVSDSAVNYLKARQSLTQKYDVTVDDGHGGTAMQTVTVTLIGTDDAKSPSPGLGKGKGAVSKLDFTDNLTGGDGSDTFRFASTSFGDDVIADFKVTGKNHDFLQFDDSIFASAADALSHATQAGQDVVLTYDESDAVTLLGVQLSQLTAQNFIIV